MHAENVEAAMRRRRSIHGASAAMPSPPHAVMANVLAERRHVALRCASGLYELHAHLVPWHCNCWPGSHWSASGHSDLALIRKPAVLGSVTRFHQRFTGR